MAHRLSEREDFSNFPLERAMASRWLGSHCFQSCAVLQPQRSRSRQLPVGPAPAVTFDPFTDDSRSRQSQLLSRHQRSFVLEATSDTNLAPYIFKNGLPIRFLWRWSHRHLWSKGRPNDFQEPHYFRAPSNFSLYLLRHRHHGPLQNGIRWKFNIFCHFSYLFLLLLYDCRSICFCSNDGISFFPIFASIPAWLSAKRDLLLLQLGRWVHHRVHLPTATTSAVFVSALLAPAETKPPTVCSFSSIF